ncbi:1337_t:CDS:2 [Gigaspora margarita]|uniref:1337_t:CDS:1 n=1 Tax=Gigaspora margarita TaxID=4874 RepID=A0ABN7VT78_GIGMA|nr:1337_t:CDS:2 [Gigaspora margarita]
MTNKKWNVYFDDNEADTWSILNFHEAWIKKYKNEDSGKLQFQKANNALVRSLRSIIKNCRDNKKVDKAKFILNIKVKRGDDINDLWLNLNINKRANAICNNSYIFEAGPLVNNKNAQLLEDYCLLFNDDNEEELSQLIDDHILNEETNLPQFNEINFELKTQGTRPYKVTAEKETQNQYKIANNLKKLWIEIVKDKVNNRKVIIPEMEVFGISSFKRKLRMYVLGYSGSYYIKEVDNATIPKDFTEMEEFIYFFEAILKWAVSVRVLHIIIR